MGGEDLPMQVSTFNSKYLSRSEFVNTHFAPCYPVTCTVSTFFFHYAAGDQSLLYHEWKNASLDRGGNGGDVASS